MIARVALVLAATFGVVVSAQQAAPQAQPYRPGPGIVNPVVVSSVQPKYTREAMQARLSGVVELEAVVLTDGTVGDVKVLKSLDSQLGLDNEAVAAAKQWSFRPGTLASTGQPVPVAVTVVFAFRLEAQKPVQGEPPPVSFPPGDDFYRDAYAPGQPGLVAPKTRRSVQPKYTSDAMRAKIQGMVEVEVFVATDGTVAKSRVTQSLDPQLDANALEAVNQWTFDAATLHNRPVPVVVKLMMEFRIH